MAQQRPGAGTAGWIAAARARESARPDRLFDDPWAAPLAGEEGLAALRASEAVTGENRFLPVRTRFVDDIVLAASAWSDQLVVLGAGYDTRAHRLPLPARTRVFEVDHPEVLARKDAVLAATGAVTRLERHVVAADLEKDWPTALTAAGFDGTAPTTWVAEGVLFYLREAAVHLLLARSATLSTARSTIVLDTFGPGLLRLPSIARTLRQRAAAGLEPPFCTTSPTELLARHGWSRCSVTEPGQPGANHGRLSRLPQAWDGGTDPGLRTYLVVGERSGE